MQIALKYLHKNVELNTPQTTRYTLLHATRCRMLHAAACYTLLMPGYSCVCVCFCGFYGLSSEYTLLPDIGFQQSLEDISEPSRTKPIRGESSRANKLRHINIFAD